MFVMFTSVKKFLWTGGIYLMNKDNFIRKYPSFLGTDRQTERQRDRWTDRLIER